MSNPDLSERLSSLPLVSLCVYIFTFSLGFGPIPWLLMSELFSPEVKERASPLSANFVWLLAALIAQFFGPVDAALGHHWTFWIFAICTVAVLVFCVFFVPETKGKSLEEIQVLGLNSLTLH